MEPLTKSSIPVLVWGISTTAWIDKHGINVTILKYITNEFGAKAPNPSTIIKHSDFIWGRGYSAETVRYGYYFFI